MQEATTADESFEGRDEFVSSGVVTREAAGGRGPLICEVRDFGQLTSSDEQSVRKPQADPTPTADWLTVNAQQGT